MDQGLGGNPAGVGLSCELAIQVRSKGNTLPARGAQFEGYLRCLHDNGILSIDTRPTPGFRVERTAATFSLLLRL
jgi:hypothetical protein